MMRATGGDAPGIPRAIRSPGRWHHNPRDTTPEGVSVCSAPSSVDRTVSDLSGPMGLRKPRVIKA
jgi:hypothetical protein